MNAEKQFITVFLSCWIHLDKNWACLNILLFPIHFYMAVFVASLLEGGENFNKDIRTDDSLLIFNS